MYALYKQFDKNGDGKITSEDIQIYLQELGLGSVSPCSYKFHFIMYFYLEII
jgi:Ca2+-binding EF-hand superfamily protein